MLKRRCGDEATARDLSQRTWAALWDMLASGRYDAARASLSTLTYAIALNIWRHHARTSQRARPSSELVDFAATNRVLGPAPATPSPDPASTLAHAELLQRVRDALAGATGLSPDEAHVLRLVASGAGDRDLARELGCSPSTANARKRQALDSLRTHLAGHSEPGAERAPSPGQSTPDLPR